MPHYSNDSLSNTFLPIPSIITCQYSLIGNIVTMAWPLETTTATSGAKDGGVAGTGYNPHVDEMREREYPMLKGTTLLIYLCVFAYIDVHLE